MYCQDGYLNPFETESPIGLRGKGSPRRLMTFEGSKVGDLRRLKVEGSKVDYLRGLEGSKVDYLQRFEGSRVVEG